MNQDSAPRRDLDALKIDRDMRQHDGPGKYRWVWLAGLVAVVAIVAFFLMRKTPLTVQVATVQPLPESASLTVLTASGYVTPRRRATVAAKITGQVKEMLVEEGMAVKEGQVLARLDDAQASAQYAAAKADLEVVRATRKEIAVGLELAQKNLHRIRSLYDDQMASREQLDTAETDVDSLKAQLIVADEQIQASEKNLRIASQNLEDHVIRAPFSGIAVSKDAQVGEMVSPVSAGGGFTRTGISTIVDMNSLEIEVDVNESYIARVYPGQVVTAVLDAYPDWAIPAHVRTVIPTADRQKATVKVRISFDQLDPRILPDMGVKVSFKEQETTAAHTAGVLVPASAVVEREGSSVVFVVHGNRAERRAIRTDRQSPEGIVVTSGLNGDETVILKVPAELSDGASITIETD